MQIISLSHEGIRNERRETDQFGMHPPARTRSHPETLESVSSWLYGTLR